MRAFSLGEKEIIKKISFIEKSDLYTFSRFLQDCVFTVESGSALVFNQKEKKAFLFVKNTPTEIELRERLAKFLEFIFLLECLERELYIYCLPSKTAGADLKVMYEEFDDPKLDPTTKHVQLNKRGDKIIPSDPGFLFNKAGEKIFKGHLIEGDEPLYQLLEGKLNSPFCCSEELRQYVANGFKDSDQIRHDQSTKHTKIALSVAIITSAISIILSTLGICQSYQSTKTELELADVNSSLADIQRSFINLSCISNQLNSINLELVNVLRSNVFIVSATNYPDYSKAVLDIQQNLTKQTEWVERTALQTAILTEKFENLNNQLAERMEQQKSNQQVDPIVTTPVDKVEAQGTQGHP